MDDKIEMLKKIVDFLDNDIVQKLSDRIEIKHTAKNLSAMAKEIIDDYDPTPCCHQHNMGLISPKEPCLEIADND